METYNPSIDDFEQPCRKCGKTYDVTLAIMQCGKCKHWFHATCTSLGKVPSKQYFCTVCKTNANRNKERLETDDVYRYILPKKNPDDSIIILEELEGATAIQIQEIIQQQNVKIEQSLKNAMEMQSKEVSMMLETMNKFMFNMEARLTEPKPSTSTTTTEEMQANLDHKRSHNKREDDIREKKSSLVVDTNRSTPHRERENPQEDSSDDSDTASIVRRPERNRTSIARTDSPDNVKHLRQTLYDLPVFTGEPTKWPKFIAAYRNSNIHAQFNDVENMMRLLKFVKGEALSLIEARLIHPSGVSKAVKILQKTYGDPVLVTDGLVKAIMDSESPRESRPSSMVLFSIKVSDLVCYIKAMEEDDQLNNHFLLREIVRRLPYSTQERWEEARMRLTR